MAKKNKLHSRTLALFKALTQLYQQMEQAYAKHAKTIGLSCAGCPDNCCNSYFHHYTYIEWAYFLHGLEQLSLAKRQTIQNRAQDYVAHQQECLAQGQVPTMLCPVNEDGLCILYEYRLMICRLHGVPNFLTLPNGTIKEFPGCFRAQALSQNKEVALLNRTPFYQALAQLEMNFLKNKRLPKIKMTLAEMIVTEFPWR